MSSSFMKMLKLSGAFLATLLLLLLSPEPAGQNAGIYYKDMGEVYHLAHRRHHRQGSFSSHDARCMAYHSSIVLSCLLCRTNIDP